MNGVAGRGQNECQESRKGGDVFLRFCFLGSWKFHYIHKPALLLIPRNATATTGQKEPTESSTEDLQKATQNPVASLISVPVQNNSNFGIGSFNRVQNVLNIPPVVPLGLTNS
jgi:hypothetical protein